MKRMITFAFCLCLVAMFTLSAFGATAPVLTIDAKDCAPGSTIQMTFGIEAGSDLAAANLEVTYDTDTFEYVSYEDGELINNCLAVGNNVDGKFLYALATTSALSSAGELFTLEFKVDSKASGSHTFYFYTTSCADATGGNLDAKTVSATVTVSGQAVSNVSVTPVTSKNEDGSTVTVSADNGESATGVKVENNKDKDTTSSKAQSNDEAKENNGENDGQPKEKGAWVVVGIVAAAILVAAGVVLLIVKSGKKAEQEEEQHAPILDEDAKALLDMEPDSLEEKEEEQ